MRKQSSLIITLKKDWIIMKKFALSLLIVGLGCVLFLGSVSTASAAGETFKVISVDTTGCASGNFGMTVERANLDGGTYYVHTVVTVGSLIYMNELASISVNGLSGWNVFDNFTYGAVPNPGTYPIPAGQTMQLDFTLERPVGTILYTWRLIVDGCDTGNIQFNGVPTVSASCPNPLPVGATVRNVPLGSPVYYAADAGTLLTWSLPAGNWWVTQTSGDFAQVWIACQANRVWIPVTALGS